MEQEFIDNKLKFKNKNCIICNNLFTPYSGKQLYCGSIKHKTGCSYNHRKEKQKVYLKEFINKNKNYFRWKWIKRTFNININDYNKLLLNQNNLCAICGNKEESIRKSFLSVDHNHKNGKIRGLLCSSCNSGIGYFYDNTNLLKNAINYLKKYEI